MTLAITLPPEIEKRLVDEAQRRGMPPSEYATQLLRDRLSIAGASLAADDVDQALDEFFAANPEPLPALPADLSREDFYSDHD